MLSGVTGTLISQFFAEEILFSRFRGQLGELGAAAAQTTLARWWDDTSATLGPSSSARSLWETGLVPLLHLLGYTPDEHSALMNETISATCGTGDVRLRVLVLPWGADLDRGWRLAIQRQAERERWWVCFNGSRLRLIDSTRVYSDCYLDFDLQVLSTDERSFAVFWGVLRSDAFLPPVGRGRGATLFDQFVKLSALHATGVCRSLRKGVLYALTELLGCLLVVPRRKRVISREAMSAAFQGSLTTIYRVLFLLFAEARGLVPVWHPIYRDGYSIEALRVAIERPSRPRGLWESLQAIARLAREGCIAGELRVTPFNGRLFAQVPTIDATHVLPEEPLQRALLALCTTDGGSAGRQRIDYRDLGVEQLGAVYEAVLDYEPAFEREQHSVHPSTLPPAQGSSVRLRKSSRERKTTGTFYTPRSITEYLVRRTLSPLVRHASAEDILKLRVLDPSMGSAAFLVAACRYLAHAYEAALVRDGTCGADDISETDRCGFRRAIAQRCLFGVDRNPMAVQLAKLSLWLSTLSAEHPLTFLDHHLRVGNSLIGATPADLARRAPPRSATRRSRSRPRPLPFHDEPDLSRDLKSVLPDRIRIGSQPSDTLADVRAKEQLLERVSDGTGLLGRWRSVADLWCACWFWPDDEAPTPQMFAALADQQLHQVETLPLEIAGRLMRDSRTTARREHFFHWLLEFPEAFYEPDGTPLESPGFDAVVGNPPWEMLRADPDTRDNHRTSHQQARFLKDSGAYQAQSQGHVNLYQAFLERAIQLTRHGGRIGMVLPSGVLGDHGAASVRRLLFRSGQTDAIILFENRSGVFPIHRSMSFVLLTWTRRGETGEIRCRMGERDPAALDAIDDHSVAAFPVKLTRQFIERASGEGLAVPGVRSTADVALIDRINRRFPALSALDGWNLAFGRELNASDDSRHFIDRGTGLPVLEGKHIQPFRARVDSSERRISEPVAARLLGAAGHYKRPRLAYREVAGATNRLTLIAAIVPAGVITTHTLFCLKNCIDRRDQFFLCGVLNSFVANFLVRMFVTTHVTAGVMGRLRVPRLAADDRRFLEIARLSERLARSSSARHTVEHHAGVDEGNDDYAQLQALVAAAYELDKSEFSHVLETFPLVEGRIKEDAMRWFTKGMGIGDWGLGIGGKAD